MRKKSIFKRGYHPYVDPKFPGYTFVPRKAHILTKGLTCDEQFYLLLKAFAEANNEAPSDWISNNFSKYKIKKIEKSLKTKNYL